MKWYFLNNEKFKIILHKHQLGGNLAKEKREVLSDFIYNGKKLSNPMILLFKINLQSITVW